MKLKIEYRIEVQSLFYNLPCERYVPFYSDITEITSENIIFKTEDGKYFTDCITNIYKRIEMD